MSEQQLQSTELREGWMLKQADQSKWMPVRKIPTNVHLDLLDNKIIEDPFLDFNELRCQWVAEKTWIYRSMLKAPKRDDREKTKYVLVFKGLDTFATVKLDGTVILKSDNMFIEHRVDVTDFFSSSNLSLEIEFKPALLEARKIKDAHPEHRWVGFNGEMSRLAVRKAQYHWGWDWGPVLMTCGPWREIYLESYVARVHDIRLDYEVDLASSSPKVHASLSAECEGPFDGKVHFAVSLDGNEVYSAFAAVESDSKGRATLDLEDVKLWYPNGYGAPSLYEVTASLVSADGTELDSRTIKTGFRKCELIQRPDASGKSFYFRVNGIDIFCGGSDWIPADSFTPGISADRYRKWMQTLVDGYQVMIRIWGGGIWEADVLYETCDELGIMVWQDFMFGCGNYPAYPSILKSYEAEADYQTKRLRHHPSMAIYAGNNEDYQVQEQYGLTYDYEDKDPQHWLQTNFPARYIYEKILPEAVAKNSPHIPYHPGSPWGDGKISSDPTVGDMHQWNVWHGTQEKYQIFDTLGGRFNSEFGMEAFPHIGTIKKFTTQDPSTLFAQSHVLDFHNKADGHERRIATYVVENFRIPPNNTLEKWIHLTQLSQAEALMFGYRGWRRQWGNKDHRHCGGALVWQLNDCWPTTSWSLIDYFLRKKPSYYAMRRVLAPIAVAVKRDHHDWSVVHAKPAKKLGYECWVSSSKLEEAKAVVELRFISIATGEDIKEKIRRNVTVKPNGATDVFAGEIDNENEEQHVLAARIWIGDAIVSRDVDWPQPLKYIDMSGRDVHVKFTADKSGISRASIKAGKPTKGLVLEEREGVLVDDSAIDVVPGDEQVVCVRGLSKKDKELDWTYLGAP